MLSTGHGTSPEPECTSTSNDIEVPGLHIVPDFITASEEIDLISQFAYTKNSQSWEKNLARKVKVLNLIFLLFLPFNTYMYSYCSITDIDSITKHL